MALLDAVTRHEYHPMYHHGSPRVHNSHSENYALVTTAGWPSPTTGAAAAASATSRGGRSGHMSSLTVGVASTWLWAYRGCCSPTWLMLRTLQMLALLVVLGAVQPTDTMLPCIYEGHLRTDRDWYGFLANVTIMTTGRMTFTFTYPADKCCQNVLFYLEDQMSILNARMNCWQKESLLRPEDDQILRLTPRFSWSGCHMSHPNGVSTYVCEGGRSFTTASGLSNGPTTWYIAVSNCASLMGLELKYRMEIIGHIGECKSPYRVVTTPDYLITPHIGSGEPSHAASNTLITDKHCVVEGDLNTTKNWHGFLVNVTLNRGGGFRFRFEYPYSRQIQNVILYSDDDVAKVNPKQSCWQREGIIISRNVPDQILDLSFRSSWNGCVTRNSSTAVPTLVCQGERRYNKGRKIFIAVSNCRSRIGLLIKYRLEFFGYRGEPCSGSRLHPGGLTLALMSVSVIAFLAQSFFPLITSTLLLSTTTPISTSSVSWSVKSDMSPTVTVILGNGKINGYHYSKRNCR